MCGPAPRQVQEGPGVGVIPTFVPNSHRALFAGATRAGSSFCSEAEALNHVRSWQKISVCPAQLLPALFRVTLAKEFPASIWTEFGRAEPAQGRPWGLHPLHLGMLSLP